MSDLLAKCDWNGDVLLLTLPEDPNSIHVKLFDSKHAPVKVYVPESYPHQWELGGDYLRLNAENEKLRDQLEEQKCFAADLEKDVKALRELVRDMFRDFADADCELKARHGRTFMAVTRYEPRLRELGIEVK